MSDRKPSGRRRRDPAGALMITSALIAALGVTGCQQRVGGLAPVTMGGQTPMTAGGAVIVTAGDTLYALSRRYEVPLRDLIEVNNLAPPYDLAIGQRLLLPAARQYVVRTGDTLYGVSRMFGVDVSELSRLNNLTPPYGIYSGQPLRLPAPAVGYQVGAGPAVSTGAPVTVAAAPRTAVERSDFQPNAPSVTFEPGREPRNLHASTAGSPERWADRPSSSTPGGGGGTVTVVPAPAGGGVSSWGAAPPSPAPPSVAAPTVIAPPVITPSVTPPAAPVAEPVAGDASSRKPESPPPSKPEPVVAASPPPTTTAAAPPPAAPAPAAVDVNAPPPPRGGGRFLMPVQGRLLSGFGPKPGGLHNDGLNIAAARGTPVVAADNGIVAYAGNELRGFGNLVLIRHADGWITAYAHLDRFDVARGAEVKRGQTIGAVGQSGGVPSPQLHFELRKGNQAVDPKDQMS